MKKQSKKARKSKRHRADGDETCTDAASTSSRIEKSYSDSEFDERGDRQSEATDEQTDRGPVAATANLEKECWTKTTNLEEKSREEEFDEYLADLLL